MDMMSLKTRRILGIVLVSAAILGWLLSLSGLIAIWTVRPSLTNTLVSNVKAIKGTLELATTGLEVTQKSLGAIVSSLETLQATVEKTAAIVNSTTPFFDSLINITDQNLPNTVDGLKSSLATAQQGAQVIDEALRKVTTLPLIGNLLSDQGYNPTTPLDKGLSNVADGINKLDETFQGMTDSLNNTKENVQAVQDSISTMATNIKEINTNLKEADQVIQQYQDAAQSALAFLNKWEDRLPELITLLAVVFSLFFIWIAATQLGLFLQGLQYYQKQ
jgi:methyl-accepting chemotaxis protein